MLSIALATLALACTPPATTEATHHSAYSSDGRASFILTDDAVQAAYAAFCTTRTNCDSVDNYKFMVSIEPEYTLIVFSHRELLRQPSLVQSFMCSNAGEGWRCHAPPPPEGS